jgi:hypothetical protein
MTTRKPRLDWIKEVLADLEDDAEHAPAMSPGIAWQLGTVSADFRSMNHRPEWPEGDDRLFCPSWQLMRLTAARKS